MKFWVVLILSATLVACGARSSDEEKVRALVESVETAAENRDASDVLEFVADDYEDTNGFDKSQLQDFLRAWFFTHPKVELLVNVDELQFPADGVAQAKVTITSLALNDPDRVRLNVEFRRQGREWRVSRADRVGR